MQIKIEAIDPEIADLQAQFSSFTKLSSFRRGMRYLYMMSATACEVAANNMYAPVSKGQQ